jgi:hypothetical protein
MEITRITLQGFWLLVNDKEYFLPFEPFPWFKEKSAREISNVQLFGKDHLYWEDLDVDLTLDMIEHPQKYPLRAKIA